MSTINLLIITEKVTRGLFPLLFKVSVNCKSTLKQDGSIGFTDAA
jgi:hypothetical protein